jgi:hypothetical protein
MKVIIDKRCVLRNAYAVGEAYTRVAGGYIDSINNNDLRLLVSSILSWQQIETAASDARVTSDAAFLAGWQADNFSEKLIAGMREPVGILDLADRLGISPPTLDEAIARETVHPVRPLKSRSPSPC